MASDGYRRGYVSFAHFLLYLHMYSLTPSFGNHLFAAHLVLKHPHTNTCMIFSSFCIPKVVKFATKKNENLTPKNDLDLVFYMGKMGNPKILNLELDFVQVVGPNLSISLYFILGINL